MLSGLGLELRRGFTRLSSDRLEDSTPVSFQELYEEAARQRIFNAGGEVLERYVRIRPQPLVLSLSFRESGLDR